MGDQSTEKEQRPTISVTGWYNHGNCGDESYKLSFPILFPQYDFTFCEKITAPSSGYILGGGDIICDPLLNTMEGRAPKHIMSATLSAPTRLDGFTTVALRDMRSLGFAAESGIAARYCPDFAFALESDANRGREIIRNKFTEERHDLYQKVVVVVLNGHLHGDHEQRQSDNAAFQHLAAELAAAMDNTAASFIFVPFGTRQPWDDRVANGWVASKCKFWKKNVVVYDLLNVQDTIDVIAAADAVISTRLHSTIFSCIANRPFIDITHNHKNVGLLETLHLMSYSMPFRGVEAKAVIRRLKQLLNDGVASVEELSKVSERQRRILKEFVNDVRVI